jgi:hypothetical protein
LTESKSFSPSNPFSDSSRFSSSLSFTPSDLFSWSDIFTGSNKFTQSLPFTDSSIFSGSNTFTSSNLFSDSDRFIGTSLFVDSASLIGVGIVGGKEQGEEEAGGNGMISAIGASLGALMLIGLLVLFFIVMKRRKADAIIEAELGDDDDTIFDSTEMGSDDVFISEYGFSDRASQGVSGDEHGSGNGDGNDDDVSGNELLVSEYGFSGDEKGNGNEMGQGHGDENEAAESEFAEGGIDSGPPADEEVYGEYGVSDSLE